MKKNKTSFKFKCGTDVKRLRRDAPPLSKKGKKILNEVFKKKIYLLSPDMSYKTFKLLQDKLTKDSGPTPLHMDRMLWELMRDKKMYCWFGADWPDTMGVGLTLPKNYEIELLSDGSKKNCVAYKKIN